MSSLSRCETRTPKTLPTSSGEAITPLRLSPLRDKYSAGREQRRRRLQGQLRRSFNHHGHPLHCRKPRPPLAASAAMPFSIYFLGDDARVTSSGPLNASAHQRMRGSFLWTWSSTLLWATSSIPRSLTNSSTLWKPGTSWLLWRGHLARFGPRHVGTA